MSWWTFKQPKPDSIEAAIVAKDVDAARAYLMAFVNDGESVELGRALQAVALLVLDTDRGGQS